MVYKITGEQPFQVLSDSFSISPSEQNYIVQVSADGENYSDLFAVSAGQTKMCTGMSNGSYYRLKNNQSEVSVNWRTTCKGGEGGGGSYVLPPATEQTLGGIKVGSGLTVQADGTLSSNGGADPEAIQEAIDANNTLIEEGEIIAGMAKQLYSPDGVTSEGAFIYRTTAGDEDVSTGPAKLQKVEGNAIYPEIEYNDSVVLMRNGSEVEGFGADIEWGDSEVWNDVNRYSDFYNVYGDSIKKARIGIVDAPSNAAYEFQVNMGSSSYDSSILRSSSDGSWSQNSNTVATADPNVFDIIRNNVKYGTITISGNWVIAEVDTYIRRLNMTQGSIPDDYQVCIVEDIPNDIPFGETTYTYDGSDWSETLPQAITAMTINGVDYVPQSGDELVVTRTLSKTGNASYPAPDSFVALGLNSFDYNCNGLLTTVFDEECWYHYSSEGEGHYVREEKEGYNAYAIRAVPSLDNGYVIHISDANINYKTAGIASSADVNEAEIDFSTTIIENHNMIVYPTAEMPYIIVSIGNFNLDKWCIHPRWSGYADDDFEDYTERVLDISSFNTDCPLLSVGNVRNIWDFENSQLIENIGRSDYSAEAVQDLIDGGKEIGVDFDFDEDYIYEVLDEPNVTDIEFENDYEANDFSVEYFTDGALLSTPVYATTWYMNNLVDKLRRMEMNFVHLDSLNTDGEVGKTYEYQGRIMKWVEGSGYTAEWLKSVSSLSDGEGTGLVYAIIPDGQTLFEFRTGNSDAWRKVMYSGDTLYYAETGGSVVCAVTIDNTFIFEGISYGGQRRIKGVYNNGYIGFLRNANSYYVQNVWDGRVQGGHYELIDKYNYPYLANGDSGIPSWNEKGQIIRKNWSVSTKDIYINATGTSSSNRTTVITNGTNNGPDRWFAPVTGGETGQTLVSAGANAAPVWETRIKVQEITSAAYDALVQAGTTDPNTLYLINDNV